MYHRHMYVTYIDHCCISMLFAFVLKFVLYISYIYVYHTLQFDLVAVLASVDVPTCM